MTAEYEDAQRVVNIIKRTQTDDGSKLSIDLPLLGSILANPDVGELPVAIYCISGPFRTGKSFLCNLLLQQNEEKILNFDISSEICSQLALENNFPFCGGLDRETEGIFMLKKPIYVVTQSSKCVALFLVDTQGLQDHIAAAEECDFIGAVSFLLSSCFFYNVQSRVNGNDLEYIYRFSKFAKRVKETNDSHSSPFQSLTFLIRDWKSRDYKHGFEGGDQYINWLMNVTGKQAEQNKFVRKELFDSFDVISCFLAPPPGERTEGFGKDECLIPIKEIDPNFLSTIKVFFDYYFGSDIAIKTINGEETTGRVLYAYMVEYANVLEVGLKGNVKNFIQAEHKAEMQILVDRYLRSYRNEMQKIFVVPFDWNKLALKQQEIRQNLLQKFDAEKHSVLPTCVTEARSRLLATIDHKFDKQKSRVDKEAFLRNALMEYKQSLRSVFKIQTDGNITRKHEASRDKLLAELNKHIPDDDIVKYSQRFVEEVQTIFVEMREENDEVWNNFISGIPGKLESVGNFLTKISPFVLKFIKL